MKVCFLAGTLGRGGAERQLVFMLKALRNCGVEARLLCLTSGEAFEQEIRSMGITVESVGKAGDRIRRLIAVVNNLRHDPVDMVQSSHFYTNIYAGLSGRTVGIPSIGAIRNDFSSEVELHGFLGSWQVRLPRFLIANSRLAYRRALESGVSPDKIAFVRNAVEVRKQKLETNNGRPTTILFVGRLHEYKRPELFVRLAAALTERLPNLPLKFQIVGDGELRGELEVLAHSLDLSADTLEFSGIREDMETVYREADLLVSTSVREGTPNVILEAMAHGLPVVATRAGGTPDILDATRGYLVDLENEDQIRDAVLRLILDGRLRRRLGAAGQRYVERNHSLAYLQDQLIDIYRKLTKHAP